MPIKVIFDTDMWSDIDDALALAMIHALEDRAELQLLAVTISTNARECASYVDLINTFYGRPHVPIGIIRNGIALDCIRSKLPKSFLPVTRYTEQLPRQKRDDGNWVYPRCLSADSSISDATVLLRETLAAQPDGSVVILEVGYHTNLVRLLASPADEISPLSGRELIARKVQRLVTMAGSFRHSAANETAATNTFPRQDPEFNLVVDIPSAQAVFANWPTCIVASGVEVGLAMRFPPQSILNDFQYVQSHPIAQTYRLFCEELQARQLAIACPHAHPTFDLTTVLYAARPDRDYFSLSPPGRIDVLHDGSTHFEQAADGRHKYLILRDEQKVRTLEAMAMLTSQPPVHRS